VRGADVRLALIMLLCAASAHAASFDAAERAIRELRYEDAQVLLDGALERGHLSRDELIALYALRGQVVAVVDDAAAGESEFRRLLVLAPDHAVPRSTPVVSVPFAQARRWVAAHGHLQVTAKEPVEPRANVPIRIGLSVVSDPFAMVDSARVAWRTGSERFVVAPENGLRPILPAQPAGAAVDYYVEVLDASQNVLLTLGSPDEPLRVELPRPAPEPVVVAPRETPVPATPAIQRSLVTAPAHPSRAGWAVGGTAAAIGVAAMAAAIGVDVSGRSQYDGLLSTCAPTCSASAVNQLHQQEHAAIGLYVTGGVGLAVAVVVLSVQAARTRHHP
jgi:hypothetical protein